MIKVMITKEGYECYRCSHQWIPQNKKITKNCPKCNSPYWDRQRKNKNNIK